MKKKMIISVTASFALFSTAACTVGTTVADPAKRMPPAYAATVSVFPSGHKVPDPEKEKKPLPVLGEMILVEPLKIKDLLPIYLKKKKR